MLANPVSEKGETSGIWWKHGVIYHIYPRSFFDSNGDGIGDLPGIIAKLDYIAGLGVDAIWLSPVFISPNYDFGYDVSDYYGINPEYGTVEDFEKLICECHRRGIRVILDMILNHTSDQHPWFKEASQGPENVYHDWFIWKEGKGRRKPNNWISAAGGTAWEFHPQTGKFYLHSFFKEQPDLNWRNYLVRREFSKILQYWLDKGVDGFRLDVINMIVKDKKFRNNPISLFFPLMQRPVFNRNRPKSIRIVEKIRGLINEFPDKVLIGEVYVLPPGDPKTAARYLSDGERGLHMTFDFSLTFTPWRAHSYLKAISNWYAQIPQKGWPCNVLSNHDLLRSINRVPWTLHQSEKARIKAFLLLTMKGTPVIYYGEEIGMKNGRIPRKAIRDSLGQKFWPIFSGRDPARTPMQWTMLENAGFTTGVPWLPVNADFLTTNVESENDNPSSLLNVYKNLIRLRKEYDVLQSGDWIPFWKPKQKVLAYFRRNARHKVLVVLNFSGKNQTLHFRHTIQTVILYSNRCDYIVFSGKKLELLPYESSIFLFTG